MEAMVQEWTDGRLDELSNKVDRGFERVDRRFEKVDADIGGLRLEMKAEFASIRDEMKTEFTAVRAKTDELRSDMKAMGRELTGRFDSIHRVMIQMMVALTAAILAGFAGICTLIAAKL